jgi:predicted MFS family arabinose efflux permease
MTATYVLQRTPRVAISAYFLAAGVGLGAWAACLPALSVRAALDNRELGIVLLCFALGAIIAMTSMGRIGTRRGTAVACIACALAFGGILFLVPFVAGSFWALAGLIFLGGGAFGALDVAMNTEASFLERQSGRHIMSSFHAVYSVGNLVGAAASAHVLRVGGTMDTCLFVAAAAVVVLTIFAWSWSPLPEHEADDPAAKAGGRALDAVRKRHLWLLGGVAFLALLGEGALMDWSAIYLVGTVGTSESAGALGFAIFAAAMATGRAVGDTATRMLGPARLLSYGAGTVAVSLAAALFFGNHAVTYVALALCGLGVANVVPIVFSAAGRIGGDAAAAALSRITTMGYAGLLVGPPFMGFLADATSLATSLSMVVLFMCIVACGGRLVAKR